MPATYDHMITEAKPIRGHNGDAIPMYYARPSGSGPFPGVVLLHYAPGGWDDWNKEVARKFAYHGYAAALPNLHYRYGPDASPDDQSAAARAAGGVPDAQCLDDLQACADFLRGESNSNGKVAVMGFCSGGRQTYLAACKLPFDAAVDCWGGGVTAKPDELTPARPVAPIEYTKDLGCPLLGLFGNEDQNPSPAEVDRTEEELKRHGKVYQFHRYDGAGHAFLAHPFPFFHQRSSYKAWLAVFAWFEQYLQA